jgi:hypothetical protein
MMRQKITGGPDEATFSHDTCLQFFLDIVNKLLLGFPSLSGLYFENENPLNLRMRTVEMEREP